MTATIKLKGGDELLRALEKYEGEIKQGVNTVVYATGQDLRKEIINGYKEGGKVGIVYEKYKPRRTHQASEEGQAPARDTGRLDGSVVFEASGKGVSVSTDVYYGPWLEYGTSIIAPRPLWRPEAKKAEKLFVQRLKKLLRRALK